MASEFYVVTALPYSCGTSSDFHVSLFFAPKISPDQDPSQLGDWSVFPHWGDRVRHALEVQLLDQGGVIDCTPIVDIVQPKVWDAAFPPDTPVRSNQVPEWDDRKWRSFNAQHVHNIGKAVHLATMYTDPTSPPLPSEHPLTTPMMQLTRAYYRYDRTDDEYERRPRYDESMATAELDKLVEDGRSLREIEREIADVDNWVGKIALELHRCRRYYERPESQGDYQERPDPSVQAKLLPQQSPEFHERCGMTGDHPSLMRRLGLVVDLRVTDPSRLRQSSWLSARVGFDGDASACRSTQVRCQAVGDDLVSVPDTADWSAGALRLGDETLFTVLDLDADGTAIKTERFLWTIPRLMRVQDNDGPVNAATPALRAGGFTVAHTQQAINIQDRLDRQHDIQATFTGGTPALLATEDVARGVRVEVWDDKAKHWSSLHRRLTDVSVEGHGVVLADLEEDGFIQGTAAHETPDVENSPIHVHDALFGWEGWSLSAERPGKRVRHVPRDATDPDGRADEVVENTPTAPATSPTHPILVRNEVAPGTLPRLRFGRSYAFRAWGVDLAGNSRAHELNPQPLPPKDSVVAALVTSMPPDLRDVTAGVPIDLRAATHSALETRRLAPEPTDAGQAPVDGLLEDPNVGQHVLGRIRERRPSRGAQPVGATALDRRSLVATAVSGAVGDASQPFVTDTAVRTPAGVADLVRAQLSLSPGAVAGLLTEAAAEALETVTPLRPFLRWDPVPSPAVVPRRRYTDGESLRVLVVRSGVVQDPDTLALTAVSPADYANAVEAAHPTLDLGYGAVTERHLAPPKTSQVQAELHGRFDLAIGSTSAANQRRMLGWALREDGSFLDRDRADIDNPPDRIPQPGVRLEHQPVTPQAKLKTLPIPPGEAPAPGQYVVHDVDNLGLPYLPDPLAAGVAIVFPEAGLDRSIPFPFGAEGFTAAYRGRWPEIRAFRFTLRGGSELSGKVTGRRVIVDLPPGDQQRLRLSSSITDEALDVLGPWQSMPPAVRANADVTEAARDGWLWGLTPSEDVLLIHAVPRPLEPPRPTKIHPFRLAGSNAVTLVGAVDVHGPSTDNLTAFATWTDPVDDLSLPMWEARPNNAVAFTTHVRPYEDLALLSVVDAEGTIPGFGKIAIHQAVHQLGDTKHRVVQYRFRASSRFREYFRPELLAPDPNDPLDDGRSVVGPVVEVSVPSSAPPSAPVVHSVIPLFRWSDGTEAEQPMARRHTRRAGVRIYLERSWFSSGDDELLGVLLSPTSDDTFATTPDDPSGFPYVSKWGQDPMWQSSTVTPRALPTVTLDNLLHLAGFDDRPEPGRPVTPPRQLPLPSVPQQPTVTVVGYRPQFNLERGLWYVDVALNPAESFWPFVQLAVARYQPDSVAGCHLSAPVRCNVVQLPPERTTSVSRTDDQHVRVVVSGPVGLRGRLERGSDSPLDDIARAVDRNRLVVARLQRRDDVIDTDLGWETVAARRLVIRGQGGAVEELAWVGELDAGHLIPLVRPEVGSASAWRVTVEEWEALPGDPPAPADAPTAIGGFPVWERRLVYADTINL